MRPRSILRILLQKAVICLLIWGFIESKSIAQLGSVPSIVVQPVGISVQNGGTAVLTISANLNFSTLHFKWQLNGQEVTNGTVISISHGVVHASTLTIPNIQAGDAGIYNVVVSNSLGSVTSSNANLIVLGSTVNNVVTNMVNVVSSGLTATGFNLHLTGPAGSNFVISACSDLSSWTPISTNAAPSGSVNFTDTNAVNFSSRFYRVELR